MFNVRTMQVLMVRMFVHITWHSDAPIYRENIGNWFIGNILKTLVIGIILADNWGIIIDVILTT